MQVILVPLTWKSASHLQELAMEPFPSSGWCSDAPRVVSMGQRQLGKGDAPSLWPGSAPWHPGVLCCPSVLWHPSVPWCPRVPQCPSLWDHSYAFPATLILGTCRGLAAASPGSPIHPSASVPTPEQHQDPMAAVVVHRAGEPGCSPPW